ncbi:MAG: glycosyltransferase [Actinobacteria bacterium]|nr:glycosyltransferase [Actinomycetota bacterium]
MKIAFFGSSLVSAYWNGAATYYRGLVKELHRRGHRITFFEPDAFDRQAHRDIEDPDWAEVVVYEPNEEAALVAVEQARGADVVVKASGVGVLDELLDEAVLDVRGHGLAVYWDVDAPATLTRLEQDPQDPLRALVPQFDLICTYGGGDPVVRRYRALGARDCSPVYNALDPETHHAVPPEPRFEADLVFVGNRLPDREARVEEFFLGAAEQAPQRSFLLAGAGWDDRALPANVRLVGHVSTNDHNALNCTPLAVLNVLRESMAVNGWSPATRVFEAAGAGACLVSDAWEGIDEFLEPGREVLVAESGDEVVSLLEELSPARARRIGEAARRRLLAGHTYAHRAEQVERLLTRAAVAA